jgi:hypothetical protein
MKIWRFIWFGEHNIHHDVILPFLLQQELNLEFPKDKRRNVSQ